MLELIRCIFCSKPTTLHNINVPKKIKGKVITVTNAPVYYCEACDETFISKEAQDVFRYIQDRRLDEKRILFSFEEIFRKIY